MKSSRSEFIVYNIGKVVGAYSVLKRMSGVRTYECQCKCGKIIELNLNQIRKAETEGTCLCRSIAYFKNIKIGDKCGPYLVNVRLKPWESAYNCECECGNMSVDVNISVLKKSREDNKCRCSEIKPIDRRNTASRGKSRIFNVMSVNTKKEITAVINSSMLFKVQDMRWR